MCVCVCVCERTYVHTDLAQFDVNVFRQSSHRQSISSEQSLQPQLEKQEHWYVIHTAVSAPSTVLPARFTASNPSVTPGDDHCKSAQGCCRGVKLQRPRHNFVGKQTIRDLNMKCVLNDDPGVSPAGCVGASGHRAGESRSADST